MKWTLLLLLVGCNDGNLTPDGSADAGPDLTYVPECARNSDCPSGQVCIPAHASCHVPSDGGNRCDDDFAPSCAPIDLDPYISCTISGDTTTCVCKMGSC